MSIPLIIIIVGSIISLVLLKKPKKVIPVEVSDDTNEEIQETKVVNPSTLESRKAAILWWRELTTDEKRLYKSDAYFEGKTIHQLKRAEIEQIHNVFKENNIITTK
jgi:hypothetical protein